MKTVIITGASGGIGEACARRFLENGYNVVGTYLSNSTHNIEDERYIGVRTDISDKAQVEELFRIAEERFGRIDAVVNNAAISIHGLVQDITSGDLDRIIDINVKGCFYMCQSAVRHMVSNHSGTIVNISSMWGEVGASCEAAYSMTKAAVIGLTKSLAKELGPSGIRVNCVTPGLIDTKMNSSLDTETIEYMCEDTPLMRIGEPNDVADAVLFLSGEKSSFITGQIIGVNGGYVI